MYAQNDDIDRLNSFLRGERAAVETYTLCIETLQTATVAAHLAIVRESHRKRVRALTDQIDGMGGNAVPSSGTWGSFSKLLAAGAGLFGDAAALAALDNGEQLVHSDYHSIADLSGAARAFVDTQLVPEQLTTRSTLRQLRRADA
jgi:Domain of unknown function (DUF2383)